MRNIYIGILLTFYCILLHHVSFGNTNYPNAILFIHGFAGDHSTWNEAIHGLKRMNIVYFGNYNLRNVENQKWEPDYSISNLPEQYTKSIIPSFTLDFSSSQNLSFKEQADEINETLQFIKSSFNVNSFILIGHSMGGLAARRYLIDYPNDDICGYISVTTPHLGSFLGYAKDLLKDPNYDKTKQQIINLTTLLAYERMGINLYSKAVEYLKPSSPEMLEMYSQVFPENVPVANIESQWDKNTIKDNLINETLLFISRDGNMLYKNDRERGPIDVFTMQLLSKLNDGVVTLPSQDLTLAVKNGNNLNIKTFHTNLFHTETNKDIIKLSEAIAYIIESQTRTKSSISSDHVTIGFILDSSGSMQDSDPLNFRKTAFTQLLDYISTNDNILIIDFDDDANWLNYDNYSSWNKTSLLQSISNIDAAGGTDIGCGLATMKDALIKSNNSDKPAFILLFTDGKGHYNEEANWFIEQNIPIYTISYKDYADGSLLNKIANESGGTYIKANSPMDIIIAFHQFILDCKNNSWICVHQSLIKQSEKQEYLFHIDKTIKSFRFLLSWMGSQIDCEIISPTGKRYDKNNVYNWISGSCYSSAIIPEPEPGKWKAVFYGTQIPVMGEQYVFNVSSEIQNPFMLSPPKFDGQRFTIDIFDAHGLNPPIQISPTIFLKTPSDRILDISSSLENHRIIMHPMDGMGDYTLHIELMLENSFSDVIQRHFIRTIQVGNGEYRNLASVTKILGNYITTGLGKNVGNHPGIVCRVFSANSTNQQVIALGTVTFVSETECQIEIQQWFGLESVVRLGDIVKLDILQWQNDKK